MLRTAELAGLLDRSMSVLVVAGGGYDRDTFLELGYQNVTISNVDVSGAGGSDFSPYSWSLQNSERLTVPDSSYDVVVVHAGLHHCRSPHAALAEMYRVARSAVIVIEARDSFVMRLGVKLGLTPKYEIEAVVDHDYAGGGVENSPLPNFVYRWTETEVDKVVRSLDPSGPPRIQYIYGLRLPLQRLKMKRDSLLPLIVSGLAVIARAGQLLFPRQGNCFGFIVAIPTPTSPAFPWINREDRSRADPAWCERRYRKAVR